jgi:hypothetical protein
MQLAGDGHVKLRHVVLLVIFFSNVPLYNVLLQLLTRIGVRLGPARGFPASSTIHNPRTSLAEGAWEIAQSELIAWRDLD